MYKLHSTLERNFANEPLWNTVVVDNRTDEVAQIDCDGSEAPAVFTDQSAPDTERPAAVAASGSAARPKPAARHPGTGIQLGVGLAFGGEDVATIAFTDGATSTLEAGSGLNLWLGGSVTPLWLDGTYGFGLGGSIGLKYDRIGTTNVDISASRWPLDLWLQALVRGSKRLYVVVAGGLHKELGTRFSISGLGTPETVSVRSPLAYMGELGLYFASSWHTGYGIGIRATRVRYENHGASVDASNVGLGASFHFDP